MPHSMAKKLKNIKYDVIFKRYWEGMLYSIGNAAELNKTTDHSLSYFGCAIFLGISSAENTHKLENFPSVTIKGLYTKHLIPPKVLI